MSAEKTASAHEQDRFGEELAEQPGSRGAQRGADRHLSIAAGVLHEQQIGDVCARDQQNQRDSAGEHVDGRADVGIQQASAGRHDLKPSFVHLTLRVGNWNRAGRELGPRVPW
jgi:hypothetical protein